MGVFTRPEPITLCYKTVGELKLLADIFLPSSGTVLPPSKATAAPGVVYFHGGGLTCGDRETWFPEWLCRDALAQGWIFISADYRLLFPCTGHDILSDVQDLFSWLASPQAASELQSHPKNTLHLTVDSNLLAATGSSAGAYLAYLAALYATPRPKALISLYGMGGDFLIPHYLEKKTKPFFNNRPLLDAEPFSALLSLPNPPAPLGGSKLVFDSTGYPADPRILAGRFLLQKALWLDYVTGEHGLSSALHEDPLEEKVPTTAKKLFPHLNITSGFPPSFLVHGKADSAVPFQETVALGEKLKEAGVPVKVAILEGRGHSFDYHEKGWEEDLKPTIGFLARYLEIPK